MIRVLRQSPDSARYACRHSGGSPDPLRCILVSLDYPYPLGDTLAAHVLDRVSWHGADWMASALAQISSSMESLLQADGYAHVGDAVALEFLSAQLTITRVGGFRVHLIRDSVVSLIGHDHNLATDPCDKAETNRAMLLAEGFPPSFLLRVGSRYLGRPHEPDRTTIEIQPGDSIVVCSRSMHAWKAPQLYVPTLCEPVSSLPTYGLVAVFHDAVDAQRNGVFAAASE